MKEELTELYTEIQKQKSEAYDLFLQCSKNKADIAGMQYYNGKVTAFEFCLLKVNNLISK